MRRARCLPVLLLAACTGCPPPLEDAGPPPLTFECELGVPGGAAGTFVPLADDDGAELILGFQGLAFAIVRLRAQGDVPRSVEARLGAEIEGQSAPLGSDQAGIDMIESGDGSFVSTDILIQVSRGDFGDFIGRRASVAVRLADDLRNPQQGCVAEGDVTLVNEDECIHTGDEPLCPDAGPLDDGGPHEAGPVDGGVDGGGVSDSGALDDGGDDGSGDGGAAGDGGT